MNALKQCGWPTIGSVFIQCVGWFYWVTRGGEHFVANTVKEKARKCVMISHVSGSSKLKR